MGFHGFSPTSLFLILVLALVVFGTKRFRDIGRDLGAAIKNFRQGLEQGDDKKPE